jgi:hypothetical protein
MQNGSSVCVAYPWSIVSRPVPPPCDAFRTWAKSSGLGPYGGQQWARGKSWRLVNAAVSG